MMLSGMSTCISHAGYWLHTVFVQNHLYLWWLMQVSFAFLLLAPKNASSSMNTASLWNSDFFNPRESFFSKAGFF